MWYTECMKLSAWAKEQGISYQAAWRMYRDGKLPVPAEGSGRENGPAKTTAVKQEPLSRKLAAAAYGNKRTLFEASGGWDTVALSQVTQPIPRAFRVAKSAAV